MKCLPLVVNKTTIGIYPESNTKLIFVNKDYVIQSDDLGEENIKKSLNRFQWEISNESGRIQIITYARNSFHLNCDMPNTENIFTFQDGWVCACRYT